MIHLYFDVRFLLVLFIHQIRPKRIAVDHTRGDTVSPVQESMNRFLHLNRPKITAHAPTQN